VPRIVLDCNIFVSALLSPKGGPAQILDQWADGDFDLVVSPLLLAELEKVLNRPKFHASIDSVHIDALLTGLVEDAVLVDDPSPQPGLTPDPGDDYLVALARKADAQCIVSGDAHLTQLVDASPPVLTPREFLEDQK
jgi:putative PIN family toxin of toxin-antitoxin system